MPATYWTLKRLGMLPNACRRATSPRSTASSSTARRAGPPRRSTSTETDPCESSQTWQVLRSEFDGMLLDNAREHGVEVPAGSRRQARSCSTASARWACGRSCRTGAATRDPLPGRGRRHRPERDHRQEARPAPARPGPEQGRLLLPLPGRAARPRDRRGGDARPPHRSERSPGSGTSRCRTTG